MRVADLHYFRALFIFLVYFINFGELREMNHKDTKEERREENTPKLLT